MALGIVKCFYDCPSQLIGVSLFAVSCRGRDMVRCVFCYFVSVNHSQQ